MQLRSSSHLNFIQAIRAGVVEKICNMDSGGKPALVFKNLKDIYGSEDSKNLTDLSNLQEKDRNEDSLFDCHRVKTDNLVERKTKEREIYMNEFDHNSDDTEDASDSDDFVLEKMTLKELKEHCKIKKRKVSHSVCVILKQDYTDLQQEEDKCDLMEPICNWKSKHSKNLKRKSNCKTECVSPPSRSTCPVKSEQILDVEDSVLSSAKSEQILDVEDSVLSIVKSEQILGVEDSMLSSTVIPAPINIEVEVSGMENLECSNMVPVSDDSSIDCSESGLCGDVTSETTATVKTEPKSGELISSTEDCQNCVLSEISYECLEHILPLIDAENVGAGTPMNFQQFPLLSASENGEGYIDHPFFEETSPQKTCHGVGQESNSYIYSQSNSSIYETSVQASDISGLQVPDAPKYYSECCSELSCGADSCKLEDGIDKTLPPNLRTDSPTSPFSNCNSSSNSNTYFNPEVVLASVEDEPPATEKPPVTSVSADTARNNLSFDNNPVAFRDTSVSEGKRPPTSAFSDTEINSPESSRNSVCEFSVPENKNHHHLEQHHPPERLLSTRKAISPTSQEKLCQAMKGVELTEDKYQYKCQEELQFSKETEDKASPLGLDADGAEVNASPREPAQFSGIKVVITPKKITKKPKSERKDSPPKGIEKGVHLLTPYLILAGAISIQSCSESAITFSQRQMHDIECLANKLMEELKSMKDIVEGQLYSKAIPSTFLKYDVDKVSKAVKSATKVEETTKKWLSMMARDCNRFCTLMKLTKKDEGASGNEIHRERKKIKFADEAGGVLCHVKFIEDSVTSPDSESSK
ncbi:LOW QUALITY PROTEIN: uncharacterized protein LOC127798658 [Diospyros lotus]|uniref:LOW QUALITY PROTEIN: uncharacterized protein LOC127798658 n=1 Tax=Diospyros lotus TaxID=55363 RepID=UPI00225BF026|nr:LOW QUALITY PROTEIN: uncharacterized protein LOC127798658 [Diospyros lotus]